MRASHPEHVEELACSLTHPLLRPPVPSTTPQGSTGQPRPTRPGRPDRALRPSRPRAQTPRCTTSLRARGRRRGRRHSSSASTRRPRHPATCVSRRAPPHSIRTGAFVADCVCDDLADKLMIGGIVPRPIGFCSTLDENGTPNLAPFSYFQAAGHQPPIIFLSFTVTCVRPLSSLCVPRRV